MGKLDAMLLYQQTELKKTEIEQAVRSTPSRVKLNKLHAQLKGQQNTIAKLTEELETRAASAARAVEQVKKLEERLDLENSEMETISGDEESTAEEMTELRVDIERLQKEINQAARETKRLLSEVEKGLEDYQQTRQSAGAAKKEYDQLRIVCEKERDDSAADIKQYEEELKKIRATVDDALFSRYEKARLHHTTPVVPVVGGKCSGCNMSLPMVMLKRLQAPDAVIECETCGRILYGERI